MRYMLDTNACIVFMRGKNQVLANKLSACQLGDLCISSITLSELLFGVYRSSDPVRNRGSLNKFLAK